MSTPLTRFKHGPPEEPASWRYSFLNGGGQTAEVTCPNGHKGDLADAYINSRGSVLNIIICSDLTCDFESKVELVGYRELRVVKNKDGSNFALYPAHNNLADTQILNTPFSGLVTAQMVTRILMETVEANAGQPEIWVPLALERYRFIAFKHRELREGAMPPGWRLPPPDEHGLVNMAAVVLANPSSFPSFANKQHRKAFDESKLALPKMIPVHGGDPSLPTIN